MKDMKDIKIARNETDLEWRPVLDGVHAYADLHRLGRRLVAERHVTDETIAYLTGELERAIADVEKLTRERDIANLALRDLAEGVDMHQCLVARPHEGILACRIDSPNRGCHACRIAGTIATLTRERDEARAEMEELRTRTAAQLEIETRARDEARADAARLRDRLQTVVDEQVSPHETLPAEELITLLEHSLAEGRHERERLRGALEELHNSAVEMWNSPGASGDIPSRVMSRLHGAMERARAALAGEGEAKRCTWTYDETHCAWDSSCGEKWILMDGGPSENEIRFCHGCGKPVEVACEATPEKARQA